MYMEEPPHVLGQMTVSVSYQGQQGTFTLYIVKGSGPSSLGRAWLRYIAMSVNKLNSSSYQTLVDQYSEVFSNEIGTLKPGFVNPAMCLLH